MKADTVTKEFMSDVNIFADAFNYYIYGGEQVIRPEQLVERDSAKIALPYGEDGKVVPVQKFRDVQKLCAVMTDGKARYVLYSAENQSEIHYAMPVKNNLYDALDYAGQVEETARSHRKAMEERRKEKAAADGSEEKAAADDLAEKRPNSGEFLSGFWKEDRLIPSVTLTIYFGCDTWDGPMSLSDMIDAADERLLSCMDDYHVRLIAPALMADEEIMKFRTELREVMLFIKYSKDKKELVRILNENNERFQTMERRAVDVINAITATGIKYEEKEMKVDVCQAIAEMRMESEEIGEKRGEKIGEKRGEKIGEKRGIQIGEKRGGLMQAQKSARRYYEMGIGVEKIAEAEGYDVNVVKGWLGL